jgi:hypothetical protein
MLSGVWVISCVSFRDWLRLEFGHSVTLFEEEIFGEEAEDKLYFLPQFSEHFKS